MDRRQQKTQKLIYDAFLNLLSRKNYSKITVKDIIEEANIGRSTFYSHFETKDHLLEFLFNDLFSHVFTEDLYDEGSHNFSNNRQNFIMSITHALYHLKENKSNLLKLLASENSEYTYPYFYKSMGNYTKYMVKKRNEHSKIKIPQDLVANHISFSFFQIVRWWAQNQLRETPEKVAAYFEELMEPIL